MKISVVIPLYNKEPHIRRTIESILYQSMPADEILVVDDGSTDGSANEVKKLSDPRIRLIQQPNAGECAARNRGVAEARNELVAFLDADDEWKPDFLTHIHRLYVKFPDCGAYATAYEEILPGGSVHFPILSILPPDPWFGIIPNLFKCLQLSNPFFPSSVAIPKRVCNDLGGFPVGIRRGGDLMMWIRLGAKYPIAYSPSSQVLYHTDAVNRACVIFPSDGESAPARLLEEMLKNQEIPLSLVSDAVDYYAVLQLVKAKELIKGGKPKLARVLLEKVKNNLRHRQEIFFWYFWSYMPHLFVNFVGRVKSEYLIHEQ